MLFIPSIINKIFITFFSHHFPTTLFFFVADCYFYVHYLYFNLYNKMFKLSTATKVMLFLLAIFPFSAMVIVPIVVTVVEIDLSKVASVLTFWALVPMLVQVGTLILVIIKMVSNEALLKDINRWWNAFGLVSLLCFHIYALVLCVTTWAEGTDKCSNNSKTCIYLLLMFEFVGFSWLAMTGLMYHTCLTKVVKI